MGMNRRATEETVPVAWIAPVSTNSASETLSQAISLDANTGRKFVAYVLVGTIGSSATVDAYFKWAATSGGTYTAITGSAIVQDVAGSDMQRIEITTEQVLAFASTALFIKLAMKVQVANTPYAAVVISHEQANLPATVPSTFSSVLTQTITGPVASVV